MNSVTSIRTNADIAVFEQADRDAYQEASLATIESKYFLRDAVGNLLETSTEQMKNRVVKAMVSVEPVSERTALFKAFKEAMDNGAWGAGRIMSNAGAEDQKSSVSTINCTVSETIRDSVEHIGNALVGSLLTLKANCGIGYEFSTLRPSGSFVTGASVKNDSHKLAVMDVQHPDIEVFIDSVIGGERFNKLRLVVMVSGDFLISAMNEGENWPLVFPIKQREVELHGYDIDDPKQFIYRQWAHSEPDYITNDKGEVACRVYRRISARNLLERMTQSSVLERISEVTNNEVKGARIEWMTYEKLAELAQVTAVPDSMAGIAHCLRDAMTSLHVAQGMCFDFTSLRPDNAFVSGAGATTSGPMMFLDVFEKVCIALAPSDDGLSRGPLPFIDIFDKGCHTVSAAGGRRGAQMLTFDCQHPNVMDVIKAKREPGRLRQFNISILITDALVEAQKADADWQLVFPLKSREIAELNIDITNTQQVIYREWPVIEDDYVTSDDGLVACRVYKTIRARDLWDLIMTSTFNYWDPGFLLIDRINDLNNLWWCENIRATNPCGEQPLPPEGACLLGSINLMRFIANAFTAKAEFDFDKLRDIARTFARMLDNVVEFNGLPLPGQRAEIMRKRRHGMGFTCMGSVLSMLGMRYGSKEAVAFVDEVSKTIALANWEAALTLAKLKGPAPIMNEMFEVTRAMLRKRPEMAKDGYKVGMSVSGKVLMVKYSRYMRRIAEQLGAEWERDAIEFGLRFTHGTSIAPTGTLSFGLSNNGSNGIEPTFSHETYRAVIVPGKKTKLLVKSLMSAELFEYRRLVNPDATAKDLPAAMVSSEDVTPEQHIAMQAASQYWVDSAISKTANCPADMPFEDFKDIYMTAHSAGLKGFTTYRPNPEHMNGVLNTFESLNAAQYEFTLADGSVIVCNGLDEVEYDGEIHVAAMLSDAIRENTYGTF